MLLIVFGAVAAGAVAAGFGLPALRRWFFGQD